MMVPSDSKKPTSCQIESEGESQVTRSQPREPTNAPCSERKLAFGEDILRDREALGLTFLPSVRLFLQCYYLIEIEMPWFAHKPCHNASKENR